MGTGPYRRETEVEEKKVDVEECQMGRSQLDLDLKKPMLTKGQLQTLRTVGEVQAFGQLRTGPGRCLQPRGGQKLWSVTGLIGAGRVGRGFGFLTGLQEKGGKSPELVSLPTTQGLCLQSFSIVNPSPS